MGWLLGILKNFGSIGDIGKSIGGALSNPLVLGVIGVAAIFWIYSEKLDAEYVAKNAESNIEALEAELKSNQAAFKILAEDTNRIYGEHYAIKEKLAKLPKTKSEVMRYYGLTELRAQVQADADKALQTIDQATNKLFSDIEGTLNGRTIDKPNGGQVDAN